MKSIMENDMKKKGLAISIEGIEATGKSTISLLLEKELSKKTEVIVTREPGGIKASEEIRDVIMNNEMSEETELLLFLASRKEHLNKKILPALEKGKTVICDRFAHSSLAYQGYGRGLGVDTVFELNDFATDGFYPDITFLIDIPVEVSMKRKSKVEEQNRLDNEDIEFYERVREGYLEMAEDSKYGNIHVIDGEQEIEDIVKQMIDYINLTKLIIDIRKMAKDSIVANPLIEPEFRRGNSKIIDFPKEYQE